MRNWKAVLAVLFATSVHGAWLPRATAQQPRLETATFGGGCYWCVEAVLQRLDGVKDARPGFMGGQLPNPTYAQVLTGRTGHVEVVQVRYDPSVITYAKLLEIFWHTHDPTTLDSQGPDDGPQYRSVVFYHSPRQRDIATAFKGELNRQKAFPSPVVTAIEAATKFYPAGDDHEDYYERNPQKQYCKVVIAPKLKKLQEHFSEQLKTSNPKRDAAK